MTRFILALCMWLTAHSAAMACDACGCSILGQPAGLLSEYRKSFLSIGWSRSGFSSTPGIGEGSSDVFHTMDLTFRYFLSDRLSAGLYQPFRINTRSTGQTQQTISGLSDTRLNVNYTFFKQDDTAKPWEIYLDIGAGFILPTGKYDAHLHDHDLPENFNPGNGSFGASILQTSSVSYKSAGVVLKNSWTQFAETSNGYTFGSQWSGNLLIFLDLPFDSMSSILPMAGIQVESVGSDLYANGNHVHGTGGDGVFFTPGCQFKFKDWLCTFQYALPLSADYSDGEVKADNRISVQLTHLF